MLPAHAMRASITYGDTVKEVPISPATPMNPLGQPRESTSVPSAHGAELRSDGVVLTGPAAFALRVYLSGLSPSDYEEGKAAASIQLSVTLAIAGSSRPIKLNADLFRQPLEDWYKDERRGEQWHFTFESTGEPVSAA